MRIYTFAYNWWCLNENGGNKCASPMYNWYRMHAQMIVKFLGANEFLPQNKVMQFLAKYGCELTDAERYICENTVFVLCGFDKAQYNEVCGPIVAN